MFFEEQNRDATPLIPHASTNNIGHVNESIVMLIIFMILNRRPEFIQSRNEDEPKMKRKLKLTRIRNQT